MDDGIATLGPRLRELRRARGLTLDAVAAESGLSPGYLSQIETGATVPSLTALAVVAAALGSELGAFFPAAAPADVRVTRAEDPERFRIEPSSREEYALLSGRVDGAPFTALLARHHPGGPVVSFRHGGEEHALVLRGRMRVEVDGEARELGPGEWIHYSSLLPHAAEVVSDEPAEALWLLSPAIL